MMLFQPKEQTNLSDKPTHKSNLIPKKIRKEQKRQLTADPGFMGVHPGKPVIICPP